ncbi:MAG: DUF58 domain-containing protein [Deltaproteobacteria bacterium]|nr:DUF58 domain-containing protein [Deltaproteobacteria bacterium]
MNEDDPLLTAAELAELDRLRRHLALRTATDGQGSRMSRRRGQSPEFVDHRQYAPGDDLRRLDWNVLARSEQTVIKRYRAEEEAAVRIAVDASASMGTGEPAKLDLARRIAAAIGYVALAEGERAQLATISVRGVDLSVPKRGKGQWGAIRDRLLRVDADDATADAALSPESSVAELLKRAGRPGILVLISDALAPNGDIEAWPRAIARARSSGHDVRFVQILSPEDIDPPWEGDLELVDAESGGTVDVTFDARAREAYARRLEALVTSLREGCRRAKAAYARARSDEAVVPVVRRLSGGGID